MTVSDVGIAAAKNEMLAGWARISQLALLPLMLAAVIGAWTMLLSHERSLVALETRIQIEAASADRRAKAEDDLADAVRVLLEERGTIKAELAELRRTMNRIERGLEAQNGRDMP